MSQPSRTFALVASATIACGPDPASSVEIEQTITELVDIGRAMDLEQAVVTLGSAVDPSDTPEMLAMRLFTDLGELVPCASLSMRGETGLRIDFGALDGNCSPAAPNLAGALRIEFSAPSPALRLATLTHLDLERAGSRLTGTTQITWGPEDTLRISSELQFASAKGRQLEIQADRIQVGADGDVMLDGWHRWQTLMGRWAMELGGWTLRPGALLPISGVASIDTPFEHDIYVDFTGESAEGLGLRANGGRSDRVFVVEADGEVVELGQP